jgi:photosystem II stability/assembly factor-like uncharacterized protein
LITGAALLWLQTAAYAAATVKPGEVRQNLFSTCNASPDEFWVVGDLRLINHTKGAGTTIERGAIDSSNAFLAVACLPGGGVVAVGQYGIAYRTRDKGATWEKLTTGSDRNILSVQFADDQLGIAVGDYGTILRTSDGGTTWTKVPLPESLPLPEDIAEIIDPGDVLLYDVAFATPQRATLVGEFGIMLGTTDGGATWTAQKSNVETTLFGVSFADENNGWAVGLEQVMLHTADGGATWEKQPVPGRSGFVLALYDVVVRGKIGWAIGDSGYLLNSTDGGASWQKVDVPIQLAANWFRGIDFSAAGNGFVVGSEGIMLVLHGDKLQQIERKS